MDVEEVVEKISRLGINLDSESAIEIAEMYIAYKYVELGVTFLVCLALFATIGFIVRLILKEDP